MKDETRNETDSFLIEVKNDRIFQMSVRNCFSGQEIKEKMESFVKQALPSNHAMAQIMQDACLAKLAIIDFDYVFDNLRKSED